MTTGFSAAADGIPTIIKSPAGVLPYPFNWEDWLETGETIAASTVTVAVGMTKQSVVTAATIITVWLAGGTIGTSYLISCTITTSAGKTDTRSIRVQVRQR